MASAPFTPPANQPPHTKAPPKAQPKAAPSRAAPRPARAALPTPEQRAALSWLHTARFLTTAAQLHQLPPVDVPEIAFVGRSNAGKSTCINTLAQQRQLAYASRTPGRTQHINLFSLGHQNTTNAVLADLPGYGYAAVPRADKRRWQQVMANYLVERASLTGVVMLCDARLGLTELDDALLQLVAPRLPEGLRLRVLLTKADKLNRSEQARALSIAKLQTFGGEVQLFSALKGQGVAQAALALSDWVHLADDQPTNGGSAQGGASPVGDDEPPAGN